MPLPGVNSTSVQDRFQERAKAYNAREAMTGVWPMKRI
ncbi:hypothetical protein ASZ90_009577 [hydrocarbon metagenome]|uniref:Uncharacterized protein n=1 Tax=hydrocarbon metagenome TaxID=938273 RepID=A0A0W8FIG5_9ZZZZ